MDLKKLVFAAVLVFMVAVSKSFAATEQLQDPSFYRAKRDHGHGITGPVHTYVKTDKHANFKWGVRHHVGRHYAGN